MFNLLKLTKNVPKVKLNIKTYLSTTLTPLILRCNSVRYKRRITLFPEILNVRNSPNFIFVGAKMAHFHNSQVHDSEQNQLTHKLLDIRMDFNDVLLEHDKLNSTQEMWHSRFLIVSKFCFNLKEEFAWEFKHHLADDCGGLWTVRVAFHNAAAKGEGESLNEACRMAWGYISYYLLVEIKNTRDIHDFNSTLLELHLELTKRTEHHLWDSIQIPDINLLECIIDVPEKVNGLCESAVFPSDTDDIDVFHRHSDMTSDKEDRATTLAALHQGHHYISSDTANTAALFCENDNSSNIDNVVVLHQNDTSSDGDISDVSQDQCDLSPDTDNSATIPQVQENVSLDTVMSQDDDVITMQTDIESMTDLDLGYVCPGFVYSDSVDTLLRLCRENNLEKPNFSISTSYAGCDNFTNLTIGKRRFKCKFPSDNGRTSKIRVSNVAMLYLNFCKPDDLIIPLYFKGSLPHHALCKYVTEILELPTPHYKITPLNNGSFQTVICFGKYIFDSSAECEVKSRVKAEVSALSEFGITQKTTFKSLLSAKLNTSQTKPSVGPYCGSSQSDDIEANREIAKTCEIDKIYERSQPLELVEDHDSPKLAEIDIVTDDSQSQSEGRDVSDTANDKSQSSVLQVAKLSEKNIFRRKLKVVQDPSPKRNEFFSDQGKRVSSPPDNSSVNSLTHQREPIGNRAAAPTARRRIYEDYLDERSLRDQIAWGLVKVGTVSIFASNYEKALVEIDGELDPVLLPTLASRNRAFHGDTVVVKVVQNFNNKKQADTDANGVDNVFEEDESTSFLDVSRNQLNSQKEPAVKEKEDLFSQLQSFRKFSRGKVVGILEEHHRRVVVGKITRHCNKCPLFAPTDPRVPRFLVPMSDCPQGVVEQGYPPDVLFQGRITHWHCDSVFAGGRIVERIGKLGDIETESRALLVEYGFPTGDQFDAAALRCLPPPGWVIPQDEIDRRLDFRDQCVITVDPASARDLDDAVSCRRIGPDLFEVGVHIADVAYFLRDGTALDDVAMDRGTSVYLVHKMIPMLPLRLCSDLCSLNPGLDKLAFSVIWKMSATGDILDVRIVRTVIRSCAKLSYDDAQLAINLTESAPPEFPEIYDGHNFPEIQNTLKFLHRITQNLRRRRFNTGAISIDDAKPKIELDATTNLPYNASLYEYKDSNKLIEELMLLANTTVANQLHSDAPDRAMLRRHPPPNSDKLTSVLNLCRQLGFDIKARTSKELERSLEKYRPRRSGNSSSKEDRERSLVLNHLFFGPMQMALYFSAGLYPDKPEAWSHYALSLPLYTHFTSPIRRYCDVVVHRQLAEVLSLGPAYPRTSSAIQTIARHCNLTKKNAKAVSEKSLFQFLSLYLRLHGPITAEGTVMKVNDMSVDILIPGLGTWKRARLDRQPEWQEFRLVVGKELNYVVIVWRAQGNTPMVTQKIRSFSKVKVEAAAVADRLEWDVRLLRPELASLDCDVDPQGVDNEPIYDSATDSELSEEEEVKNPWKFIKRESRARGRTRERRKGGMETASLDRGNETVAGRRHSKRAALVDRRNPSLPASLDRGKGGSGGIRVVITKRKVTPKRRSSSSSKH